MIRIGGMVSARPVPRADGSGVRDGFSVPDTEIRQVPHGAALPGLAGLADIMALQEAQTDTVADREARRHAEDVLETLAALQRALLAGGADPEVLRRLADLAGREGRAADPGLRQIARAVALRARVELARRSAPNGERGPGERGSCCCPVAPL